MLNYFYKKLKKKYLYNLLENRFIDAEIYTNILYFPRGLTTAEILALLFFFLFTNFVYWFCEFILFYCNYYIWFVKFIPGYTILYKIYACYQAKILPFFLNLIYFIAHDISFNFSIIFLFCFLMVLLILVINDYFQYFIETYQAKDWDNYISVMDDIVSDILTIPNINLFLKNNRLFKTKDLKKLFFFSVPRYVIAFRWWDMDYDVSLSPKFIENIVADRVLAKSRKGTLSSAMFLFLIYYYVSFIFVLIFFFLISPTIIFCGCIAGWVYFFDFNIVIYDFFYEMNVFYEVDRRMREYQKNKLRYFELDCLKNKTILSSKRLVMDFVDYTELSLIHSFSNLKKKKKLLF